MVLLVSAAWPRFLHLGPGFCFKVVLTMKKTSRCFDGGTARLA